MIEPWETLQAKHWQSSENTILPGLLLGCMANLSGPTLNFLKIELSSEAILINLTTKPWFFATQLTPSARGRSWIDLCVEERMKVRPFWGANGIPFEDKMYLEIIPHRHVIQSWLNLPVSPVRTLIDLCGRSLWDWPFLRIQWHPLWVR